MITNGLLLPVGRKPNLDTMNFCGPYDKHLATQYRPLLHTPLLAGWEFRHRPALVAGKAGWLSLAKTQDWALTTPIRHDLLSDKLVIVVTDTDQRIQYVNARFEEMTGYASREAIGRRPTFLQGESTSPLVRQRIRQSIESQRPVRERVLNYRKDKTPYWCKIVIRPIMNRQKQVVNYIAFEEEVPFDESFIDR